MTDRSRTDLVMEAARALWGERCNTELKGAIGVNIATVQRWKKGQGAPGPEATAALHQIVESRIEALQRLSNQLRRDSQEKAK